MAVPPEAEDTRGPSWPLLIHSRSGLRFHRFEDFVATTQLNYGYDESPAPGRERDDLRYVVNLGFQW